MDKASNKKLGEYELVRRISDGAQASVYEAKCARDGETVALKLFKYSGDDATAEMRFQKEAAILRDLSHRNIVRYRDSFSTEGDWEEQQHCLVTEFMEGSTLKDLLNQHPKGLPWPQARDIMEQILAGLICASAQGVIHRDIKPSNVFILRDGQVKLFDFGIARMAGESTKTSGGSCMGSFDYMAPDFALADTFIKAGDPPFRGDELSDIFSLTLVFYEMLTGELPWGRFGDHPELEYLTLWKTEKAKSPSHGPIAFRVIRHLTGFVDRGLSIDRSARFRNFTEMLDALRELRTRVLKHKEKDDYELLEGLDKGGFGEVYKARRARDGKIVAIKRLFTDRASRRFIKEAAILRKYVHPNLVEYVDFFESVSSAGSRQLFLAMEYLEGMPGASLRNRIRDAGRLDPGEALEYFRYYLDALRYLHENVNQIIHRDIKPGNLYAPAGNPAKGKILDLGVARDVSGTQTHGSAPGTWDYMAPEFVTENSRGTPQSDIYALGLSLYEAVTGASAFPRSSKTGAEAAAEFVARATGTEKHSVDFTDAVFRNNPAIEQIIRKSIHRDPAQRYAGAAEMRAAIMRCLRQMGRIPGEPDDFEDPAASSQDVKSSTRAASLATLCDGQTEAVHEWQSWVSGEKNKRRARRGIAAVAAIFLASAALWAVSTRLGRRPDGVRGGAPPMLPPAQPVATGRTVSVPAGTELVQRQFHPVPEPSAPIPAAATAVAPHEAAVPVPAAVSPSAATAAPPPIAAEPPKPVAKPVIPEITEPPSPAVAGRPPRQPGPAENEDASQARDLVKDLRLLRIRNIVATSYEAFLDDAAARMDNARLVISQPEYETVKNHPDVKTEQERLVHHIAENALQRHREGKDGRYLAVARGALWSAIAGSGNIPESMDRTLRKWNGMSKTTDFTAFLPLPGNSDFKPAEDPGREAAGNAYVPRLFKSPGFNRNPCVMFPPAMTAAFRAQAGKDVKREEKADFILVPAAPDDRLSMEDSFYMASVETTYGQMRCYRDAARAELMKNSELSRFFTGRLESRSLQANEMPYEIRSVSEAFEFCNWLSHSLGYTPVYRREPGSDNWTALFTADGFRIPTETEWEYAARFGMDMYPAPQSISWERVRDELDENHPDGFVWSYYKEGPRASDAPGRVPSPLGLFDMCGNLGELAMRHARWQDMGRERPAMSACGGTYRHRTAEKVMPWSRENFGSAENTGFRVIFPLRVARLSK